MDKKQTKGLQRNTIDKYYTKPAIVLTCIEYIKTKISILENDVIIEPSAGNGSFIQHIKSLGQNYKFYDLEPEHNDIEKQDYLQLNNNEILKSYTNIHIIGNPPFGRQASLAIKFIKKSCEFCNTLSFILPKSFKKESMKNHFPLHFHLVFEIDLPEKSFLVNNEEYTVPCIFQIWIKKDYKRLEIEKKDPLNFIIVNKNDNPDISVRRVGVYAGKIDTNLDKSIQSNYFIKFTNDKNIEDNIELLKNIHFQHNNTVGPRSISKPELIEEFNKFLY